MAKKTEAAAPADPGRNELIAKIEGELPYDRTVYVREIKFYLQDAADSMLEAGKRLLIIKEKEVYGDFVRIVEDEIGIPKTTAYRLMNAAIKSDKFPAIDFSQRWEKSKVYTLLEAPEEDLKELEEKGVMAGKDMDELAAMSFREMKALIKHLKTQTSAIVASHVKKLSTENQALRNELKDLSSRVPNGPDTSWAEKHISDIEANFVRLDNLISSLAFDPHMVGADNLKASIEGFYGRMKKRFILFIDKWESYTGHPAKGKKNSR